MASPSSPVNTSGPLADSAGFGLKDLVPTKWGWGRKQPEKYEVLAWNQFSWKLVFAVIFGWPAAVIFYLLGFNLSKWTLVVYLVCAVLSAFPILAAALYYHSRLVSSTHTGNPGKYLTFRDKAFEAQWKGKRVPILELYNAYIQRKVDINGDLLTALYDRYEFADFVFTKGHVEFFLFKLIPEALWHSRTQDKEQVTDHYDRGNDFYGYFLGETMTYTSGIFYTPEDTLETAQYNKFDLVARKLHLKEGDKHLDIGCGWGTFIKHCALKYKTNSTGVTIAREQVAFAEEQIKRAGVSDRAKVLLMDYRDIPQAKYNKISCLEMAEHVGVLRFSTFLRQVYDLLEDDGLFYLQIAGLRRAWQVSIV